MVNLVLPTGRQVPNEARTGILLSTSAKQEMQSSYEEKAKLKYSGNAATINKQASVPCCNSIVAQ